MSDEGLFIVVYHRNGNLYWLNFTSRKEAERVRKDLQGLLVEGKYIEFKGNGR